MGRILVIEDDEAIASGLEDILGDAGYECSVARNGEEGLAYLRAHPAPSAIVLDLMMPVMNGLEFRKAQLEDPVLCSIPVVIMSAGTQDLPAELQPTALLRKPFQVNRLLRVLARIVDSQARSSGESRHDHVVHFYHDHRDLSKRVASFTRHGLERGESALVIARAPLLRAIEADLRPHDQPANEDITARLSTFEATKLLPQILSGEIPDRNKLEAHAVPLLERAARVAVGRRIRIYGEMVDILFHGGNVAGAMKLEDLWTELLPNWECSLLCGYYQRGISHSQREAIESRHSCSLW